MSGNEPNKHKRGEGWGDGGPIGEIWKKQTQKKVTNFIGILGFPDFEAFLPRRDSVSFFFVLEKIKGFKYRARGDNMTF